MVTFFASPTPNLSAGADPTLPPGGESCSFPLQACSLPLTLSAASAPCVQAAAGPTSWPRAGWWCAGLGSARRLAQLFIYPLVLDIVSCEGTGLRTRSAVFLELGGGGLE